MDSQFGDFYDAFNNVYPFYNGTMSPGRDESLNYATMFNYKDPSVNLTSIDLPTPQTVAFPGNLASSSTVDTGSPDDGDYDPILKYISQVLMEENMDEKPCMFHGPLVLQAAEKPFYDALGQKYPPSPDQHPLTDHCVESPEGNFSASSSDTFQYSYSNSSGVSSTNTSYTTSSVDFGLDFGSSGNNSSLIQTPSVDSYDQPSTIAPWSFSSLGSNPSLPEDLHLFNHRESMLLFQKGAEEASKFLPRTSNLFIDLDSVTLPEERKRAPVAAVAVKSEKEDVLPEGLRVRKFGYLDDNGDSEGGRSSKQSAVSVEDVDDLSEMFDKVLLCNPKKSDFGDPVNLELPNVDGKTFVHQIQPQGLDQGAKGHQKKQDAKKSVVDLRSLLMLSAQAVTSDDRRTASELLKQIRQHSSPLGDGSQRLAHFFANALEARLAGTGSQIYTALASKRTTAAEILKAYQLYVSSAPFKKLSNIFSNHSILKVAEKRQQLHIIDFGIMYGFKWPMLIKRLAERCGGPPVLHITGIELPQPGFKPAERVEESGRRLAKYCERFGVPFKYHAIAQKWETVKLEDLKLEDDEAVAVVCHFRFKNLLDETVLVDSPRNAVLKLIRKVKPDLFVHGVVSGSFNAPFFITRFREALFHYSTLFDMFDANVSRENLDRSMYEREFYGREIMNAVACEGTERVERPETYKQWQVRNTKAGFRQLPVDPEFMKRARNKLNSFHKDYSINVDGNWTLMGWKGRIAFAISAWIPT